MSQIDTIEPEAAPSASLETKALVGGAGLLALATIAANAGNYALNLLLGRWLTPAEFGDANLMVTLMLLVTAIAIALQLVVAHAASIDEVRGRRAHTNAVATWLRRWALALGAILGAMLALGAPLWQTQFRTASAVPFVVLGLGMPAYLAQAVGRGLLQGRLQFRPLAASFIVEMIVRLGLGVGLTALGFGVTGATVALSISFAATWLVVHRSVRATPIGPSSTRVRRNVTPGRRAEIRHHAGPIGVLLLGQIVINNGDVLVVKNGFDEETAGIYAAVALGGRAVFFLSWAVVTTLFPAVAQRDEAGEKTDDLLIGGIAVVVALCVAMIAGAALLGGPLLGLMLGDEYAVVGPTLARYATATSLFAVANLIVTHRMSAGGRLEPWLLVGGGVLQTGLLIAMRGSINGIVAAQVIAMGFLLAVVAVRPLLTRSTIPCRVEATI